MNPVPFPTISGILPPTGSQLSVKHNNNQAIPMALMWRDFFSFLFLEDNTTALRQFQTNFPKGAPWEQAFNLDQVSAFRPPSDLSNDTWWRISTRKSKKIVSQVAELESFVEEQQGSRLKPSAKTGFIWEVYTTPYVWRDDLSKWFLEKDTERRRSIPQLGGGVPGGLDGCRYSWRVPSPLAMEIVDLVFERIRLQHPSADSLGLFHIRRGDSVDACDTSLPRIHDYLSCTFPNEEPRRSEIASRFGKVVLLLASDERDLCYREAIRQLVEQGLGYGFVDLDETIQAVVKDYASRHTGGDRLVNNMYVYHILTLIAEDARVALVLEQRRHIKCPNCTDVMKYLNGGEGRYFYSPGLRSTAPSSMLKWHFPQTVDQYEACANASKEGP